MSSKQRPLYIQLQTLATQLKKTGRSSREQRIVITKLEEASMWAERMYYLDPDISETKSELSNTIPSI